MSAASTALGFRLVSSVGDLVKLQSRSQLCRLQDEGFAEGVDTLARVAITIAFTLLLALFALKLLLVLIVSETLLEEGGDGVCDTLELLVALCLCGLETTCNMPPNEGHRYGVGAGPMVGYAACAGLVLDGIEDSLGGEHERTWRLTSRQARVGHVGAAVSGRGEGVAVSRNVWREDGGCVGGDGAGTQKTGESGSVADLHEGARARWAVVAWRRRGE